VHEYPDGALAVFHGPRLLARYECRWPGPRRRNFEACRVTRFDAQLRLACGFVDDAKRRRPQAPQPTKIPTEGIAEIQEGLEKERATGALLFESYTLALLADACIKNERYGQAFDFLIQAQSRLDEANSERFYAAEIYRLLGETYLRSGHDLDQAERYLSKGLEVAREQKAKSLELKLCISIYDLCELRQNADKYRFQLSKICESFSEGFDTADLIRAKARVDCLIG
jgi:tetratricopeptide (TPR) repeat protein